MKGKLRLFLKGLLISILVCGILAPAEADARKRSSKTKASTTATSKKKKTKSRKTSKRTRRKNSSGQSVTQATQEVAIKASVANTTAPNQSAKEKKKETSLRKITVDKPDLEAIRTATLNPADKYYYPKLWAKYQRNDTTMTAEEYRYFYLGYMFQEDYDPYRTSPYSGMTDSLRLKPEHTKEEIDTIRKYAEKALLDNPFDLRQMSFLVHVLKEKRKDMSAKIWEYRLEHLLGAIKSTGTGEDIENAWYVIYPMHEYDIIQILGYEANDVDYIEPGFDYLMVTPDGTQKHRQPVSGFYFNVQVPQQQYDLKHPDESDMFLGADEEEAVIVEKTDPDDVIAE